MASSPKILLIGATGYVGGTVLHQIMNSSNASLMTSTITVLVRGADRIEKLQEAYGSRITCRPFTNLSETSLIQEVCSDHDIVINAGTGFHPDSAEAMVYGLAKRMSQVGRKTWIIHTSGCTNIGDMPITGESHPDREFSDDNAIAAYRYEKEENVKHWYAQRAAELAVLDAGIKTGVGAVSLQAPCVFGGGEGLFNTAGLVIPGIMKFVVESGFGFRLGDGSATIDYVHVSDLADLYLLVLINIIEKSGIDVPTGEHGIVFPTNGRVKWTDIARNCLDVAFEAGVLPREDTPQTKEIVEIDLEAATKTTAGDAYIAEVGLAGHRLTKGVVAREKLGWKPARGEEAWLNDFKIEFNALTAGKRGITMANCIAAEG